MGNYMTKRKLGNSSFEIAPLVLGGNVFGWTVDEAMSFALLDAFIAAGFNMIDTADVYSLWAPGNKGGKLRDDYRKMAQATWPARRGNHRNQSWMGTITSRIKASLKHTYSVR